jgi:tetratricopeptide (TPR) repeat protein
MKTTKKIITSIIMLMLFASIGFAQKSLTINFPESLIKFRDDSMNNANKSLDYYTSAYDKLVKEINSAYKGNEKEILLARSEYFMGRIVGFKGERKDGEPYFDSAIERCKKILKSEEMAEAYLVYAECISQNCTSKNKMYALSNGPKIKTFSQKALDIDSKYGAAKHAYNLQNIYTPAPFNNYEEGIQCLEELLFTDKYRKDNFDIFMMCTSMVYVYQQKNNNEQTQYWAKKGLEIYPENQFLLDILK